MWGSSTPILNSTVNANITGWSRQLADRITNGGILSTLTRSYSSEPPDKYDPPAPFRKPGARRYGWVNKLYGGGVLPRSDKPIRSLPAYKPKDSWNRKRALFGQNDYIDILGDGDIHPVELITGPKWLIGFKGNELQRLVRRAKIQGSQMRYLYPTKYHQMWKRIRFLNKKYNMKRSKRVR
ncbi:hypothetical protein ScPMuIL_008138 [Solemya velum]